jgi:hypothetical protein
MLHMKKMLITFLTGFILSSTMAQNTSNYSNDAATVLDVIKTNVFKNNYKYLITYDNVNHASMFVKEKTDYLVYFVYDNSTSVATDFKGFLMTPDNELKKKYTAKPEDIGQVGAARVKRLKFSTGKFSGEKDKYPVKLEASPNATIYIFYR